MLKNKCISLSLSVHSCYTAATMCAQLLHSCYTAIHSCCCTVPSPVGSSEQWKFPSVVTSSGEAPFLGSHNCVHSCNGLWLLERPRDFYNWREDVTSHLTLIVINPC